MGSKRSKKNKQELELFPEKNNIKKNKEKDETLEPEIKDFNIIENNGVVPAVISKAPKRKKKSEGIEEVPKKLKKTNDSGSDTRKVKPRKRKSKTDSISSIENVENEAQLPVNGENQMEISENNLHKVNKNDHADKKKEEITWPDQDIGELINRMESNIPEKDILAYRSRVEKLNWDNVAFKSYTPEECKKTWMQVQKRIRRFRLLSEILNDAKEWINSPRINHKAPRPKKHPDMPRRPLSSYLLFYLKKKDQIISENPGLDGSDITKLVGQTYKNLPPEKREKYEKLAASNREEYLEKLKVFFENHPEFVPPPKTNHKLEKEKAPKVEKEKMPKPEKEKTPKTLTKVEKEKVPKVEKDKVLKDKDKDKPKGERAKPGRPPKSSPKAIKERPPKKCQTPFGLYYASELKNMEPGTEKQVFRDKCKMQYKQMSDKKKMFWITLAEQDLIRYQEEVKSYKERHPEYQVIKVRPILTKREKVAKERASGKPIKPPNSAYALYSRLMLQSEEIKTIHPKERMNYIANKWKNSTEEERNLYRDQVINMMEEYKLQFASYLDSLPEEEKRKVITQSKRKGRKAASKSNRIRKPRKRRSVKRESKQPPPTKLKFTEPEQPPISACKYFATLYKGEGDAVQVWKTLNPEEKRRYEDELVKKKQAYIIEFEKFLKSLSKEELEAFSKLRQQQVKSEDEESSECSSDSDGDDDGGGDDEDDDDDDDDEDDDEVEENANENADDNEENGANADDVPNNEEGVHESDTD